MPYMILVVEDPGSRPGGEAGRQRFERMVGFAEDLRSRGVLLATESLTSQADGVRIRKAGGKRTIVDGPFAEAKEIIGGFFLIDVNTRDEAAAIASECPAAEWSTIEVRGLGPCF
jgi:hypothetical protein